MRQNGNDQNDAGGKVRIPVATVVSFLGLLFLVSSIPPLLNGLWFKPPVDGVPAEIARGLIGFSCAGAAWLLAGFCWAKKRRRLAAVLTVAGMVLIGIAIEDK